MTAKRSKRLVMRVHPIAHRRVKNLANERGLTISDFIAQAISISIANYPTHHEWYDAFMSANEYIRKHHPGDTPRNP